MVQTQSTTHVQQIAEPHDALNDDQLQTLWGRTLYEALRTHDAIMVSEPERGGLLRG
jgi:hypothetical protein